MLGYLRRSLHESKRIASALTELRNNRRADRPQNSDRPPGTTCPTSIAREDTASDKPHPHVPAEVKDDSLLDKPQPPIPQPEGETVESLVAKLEKGRALLQGALRAVRAVDLTTVMGNPERGGQYTLRWLLTLMSFHGTEHYGHMKMIRQHLS